MLEDFKINIKTQFAPQAGRLLIAEPLLQSSAFSRSTIYLLSHNSQEGTIGFVTNKPTDYTISDILEDFKGIDIPVYDGGPVGQDSIYVAHRNYGLLGGTLHEQNVSIGANYELLREMINCRKISLNNLKFFKGYAGWSPTQLEQEIKENAWLINKNGLPYLFNYNHQESWKKSIQELGNDYAYLINFPTNPQLN